ncbi:MAG: DinB family protein [Candidatus Eisenbacteria bacterium]|nr:DinB family protein [Candidatus Eisenbacteria bacterium]
MSGGGGPAGAGGFAFEAFRELLWSQFGASIDMLGNAMRACPDALWADRTRQPEFWYVAFHTLFWLDYYLYGREEGFAPPPPYTLDEMDPAGLMPERPYTKEELLAYLASGRRKCREAIGALTPEGAAARCGIERRNMNVAELHLYNLRHVQHHAAQLNLILRQATDSAPRWVSRAPDGPGE